MLRRAVTAGVVLAIAGVTPGFGASRQPGATGTALAAAEDQVGPFVSADDTALFHDDFSADAGGWGLIDDPKGTIEWSGDALAFTSEDPGISLRSEKGTQYGENF